MELSLVTKNTPEPILPEISEEKNKNFPYVSVSRMMLELYKQILPSLQKFADSTRLLETQSYENFLKHGSSESGAYNMKGWSVLPKLLCAVPNGGYMSDGIRQACIGLTESAGSFIDGGLQSTGTVKSLAQEMFSRFRQDVNTISQFADKILEAVQRASQTEKLIG